MICKRFIHDRIKSYCKPALQLSFTPAVWTVTIKSLRENMPC